MIDARAPRRTTSRRKWFWLPSRAHGECKFAFTAKISRTCLFVHPTGGIWGTRHFSDLRRFSSHRASLSEISQRFPRAPFSASVRDVWLSDFRLFPQHPKKLAWSVSPLRRRHFQAWPPRSAPSWPRWSLLTTCQPPLSPRTASLPFPVPRREHSVLIARCAIKSRGARFGAITGRDSSGSCPGLLTLTCVPPRAYEASGWLGRRSSGIALRLLSA